MAKRRCNSQRPQKMLNKRRLISVCRNWARKMRISAPLLLQAKVLVERVRSMGACTARKAPRAVLKKAKQKSTMIKTFRRRLKVPCKSWLSKNSWPKAHQVYLQCSKWPKIGTIRVHRSSDLRLQEEEEERTAFWEHLKGKTCASLTMLLHVATVQNVACPSSVWPTRITLGVSAIKKSQGRQWMIQAQTTTTHFTTWHPKWVGPRALKLSA